MPHLDQNSDTGQILFGGLSEWGPTHPKKEKDSQLSVWQNGYTSILINIAVLMACVGAHVLLMVYTSIRNAKFFMLIFSYVLHV